MDTFSNILEDFEKLAYKILLSIIILPKTILQIILDPAWVPGYVRGELNKEEASFNNYLSPVILLLAVALTPAIILTNFLPTFGVELTSPAEQEPTTDHFLIFEAETNSKSSSKSIFNRYSWYVEKIAEDGSYSTIYWETYDEFTEQTEIITVDGEVTTFDGEMFTSLEYPEQKYSSSKDTFFYVFEEPGTYYMNVEVAAFDPTKPEGGIIESFYAYRHVKIPAPDDPNQQVLVSDFESREETEKESSANFSDVLNNETTIFLALGLLFPPLLFALASKLFRGEEVSEYMLRENFYFQCYYFSPLSLAIWATYYARYFLTPDVFFYQPSETVLQMLTLPPLLAIAWFIGAETEAIAQERQIQNWKALFIVMICLAILGSVAYLVYMFLQPYSQIQNSLRLYTIFGYPVAAVLLVLAFFLVWLRKHRVENQKVGVRSFAVVAVPIVVAVLLSDFLGFVMAYEPETPAVSEELVATAEATQPLTIDIQSTPTIGQRTEPPATPATPTVPTEQLFITEEFDGDLSDWRPWTISGLEEQVSITPANGALAVELSPHEDKVPTVFLINDSLHYTNVQMEAVVTNNGINANEVSLVCRFSDQGWYEFNVSNGGTYSIYVYDWTGAVHDGYHLLADGGSPAIRSGHVTNTYTAVCMGSELSLYVNGTHVETISETDNNFIEGSLGIGASSPQTLPVNVQFEAMTISQP